MPGWSAFVNLLFQILQQIYYVVGDWGLAIIVFTVAVRLLLTPLMVKQVRSMAELQKVQPLIKEVQEKYKDDKELAQQKQMELMAEHKVNPFASCLPMLLQMPIFIAFYQMLANETIRDGVVSRAGGPLFQYLHTSGGMGSFYNIIPNIMLSASSVFDSGKGFLAAIPYFILLAIFALSIYIPQMMQHNTEKSQKMMSLYMSVFMLFIGWSVPAGVLLYWDTSSIIGIAQQWFVQRQMKKATEDEEDVVEIVEVKKSKKSKN